VCVRRDLPHPSIKFIMAPDRAPITPIGAVSPWAMRLS
jgi:hypothetical protein